MASPGSRRPQTKPLKHKTTAIFPIKAINELQPGIPCFIVRARLISRSHLLVSKGSPPCPYMRMKIADATGTISIAAFGEDAKKFDSLVQVGLVYDVSCTKLPTGKCPVATVKDKYVSRDGVLQIIFNSQTEMSRVQSESPNIPAISFLNLQAVAELDAQTRFNFLGIITGIWETVKNEAGDDKREINLKQPEHLDEEDVLQLNVYGGAIESTAKFHIGDNIMILGARYTRDGIASISEQEWIQAINQEEPHDGNAEPNVKKQKLEDTQEQPETSSAHTTDIAKKADRPQ